MSRQLEQRPRSSVRAPRPRRSRSIRREARPASTLSTFTLTADNSWSLNNYATADSKLLSDFADQNPSLSFSGVHSYTPDGYTVVVYYNNNENFNSDSNLTVNGDTKEIFTSDVATSYLPWRGTTPSNYAVFTGINGDTLNISLAGVTAPITTVFRRCRFSRRPRPTVIAGPGRLGGHWFGARRPPAPHSLGRWPPAVTTAPPGQRARAVLFLG